LEVGISVEGQARRLEPLVETVLFRVAQQSLGNVARHAKTSRAVVRIAFRAAEVAMTVEDHGCGFDPSQSFSEPRGWGLAGMRERVEALGGSCEIESAPGRGTAVLVVLPEEREGG
jgi:signal transduction histidine kinase